MAHTLTRETFHTSRAMDLFSERTLATETGHGKPWWPEMILKELVDNALDAAEAAGVAPEVQIVIDPESITVEDNGDGLPIETIEAAATLDVRASSNAKYIAPSRGSQGNALLTLLAVPLVADGEEGRVDIEVGGNLHEISIRVDPIEQKPVVDVSSSNGRLVKTGTSVKLLVSKLNPDDESCRFLQMAVNYGFFNPHAMVSLDAPQGDRQFGPTDTSWKKWLPSMPPSSHWYQLDDLIDLATACISSDRRTGMDRTVRQFLTAFDGFKGSSKQKLVLDAAGVSGDKLSSLAPDNQPDRELFARLLEAMQRESREISPAKLGVLGEKHLKRRCVEMGGDPATFRYKKMAGTQNGIPYVFEAAFAARLNVRFADALVVAGVNWSAAIRGVPFDHFDDDSVDGLLESLHCGEDEPVIVVIHLATPKVNWTDKGKSRTSLIGSLAIDARKALENVASKWHKQRSAEDRQASQRANRNARLTRQKEANNVTLKDAVLSGLAAAINEVSGGGEYQFDARTLYYSIRPAVQDQAGRALTQGYLDRVLKDHQRKNGVIDLMLRDPRGYLIEPHTGRVLPLGTRRVDAYQVPAWCFHTVLYVEKKGMAELLRKAAIADRCDTAIIAAEGYGTDAAKLLMSKANEQDINLLCLHDADPWGKNIHRNLETAGLRSDNINVIDIGLDLEEAINMGLGLETFNRDRAIPQGIALTDVEKEHWEGEWIGKSKKKGKNEEYRDLYRCSRIELNALAAVPQKFIDYVNRKLEQHGLAKKLVPPDSVVSEESRSSLIATARSDAENIIAKMIDIEALLEIAVDHVVGADCSGIPSSLAEWAENMGTDAWRDCVKREVARMVRERRNQIEASIRKSLEDRIGAW